MISEKSNFEVRYQDYNTVKINTEPESMDQSAMNFSRHQDTSFYMNPLKDITELFDLNPKYKQTLIKCLNVLKSNYTNDLNGISTLNQMSILVEMNNLQLMDFLSSDTLVVSIDFLRKLPADTYQRLQGMKHQLFTDLRDLKIEVNEKAEDF